MILDALIAATLGAGDGPKKAFGPVNPMLNRDYADAEKFDVFRDILRACIMADWPHASGDVVLGRIVEKRSLHSVATAAQEIGVGNELLDRVLTEKAAFPQGDHRPLSRKTFDAHHFHELLEDIPNWVGQKVICSTLGATKAHFQRLVEQGVLTPMVDDPKVKARWQKRQAEDLIDSLLNASVSVSKGDANWFPLHNAGGQAPGGLKHLFDEVLDGKLSLGSLPHQHGYRSFVVPKSAVIAASADRSKADKFEFITAVAFARSIGLRQKGAFLAFIEDGHSPATLVKHPNTKQPTYIVAESDIEAFKTRFTTLTLLSEDTGQHRNSVRHALTAAQVKPFSPRGQEYGGIYLKADAARVFHENN